MRVQVKSSHIQVMAPKCERWNALDNEGDGFIQASAIRRRFPNEQHS